MSAPTITLHHGECIEIMRTMPADSVDAIVTDPPYGLGFMGKAWDDLPPGEEWARECLRVLKPGGHLLAFGGTRTWHRLAVAVEDAGFEMRDSLAWLYGSGFPKSLNVSTAVEKLASGPMLELLPEESRFCAWLRGESGLTVQDARRLFTSDRFLTGKVEIVNTATKAAPRYGRRAMVPTAAAWEVARPFMKVTPPAWVEALVKEPPVVKEASLKDWNTGAGLGTVGANQWAGWGTALKPAFEPIVMARKPLIGTVAANVQAHGTGALNIDASRIGYSETEQPSQAEWNAKGAGGNAGSNGYAGQFGEGLKQAYADGKIEVPAGRWPANVVLDESMAAELDEQSGTTASKASMRGDGIGAGYHGSDTEHNTVRGFNDTGGASRFFYVAKAPKRERPVVDGVAHATVKPLAIMEWLITLVTPPGGVVLDPFGGSGTTAEAAARLGFDSIVIEREEEYLPLIMYRALRSDVTPVVA